MNTNPALVMGLASAFARRQAEESGRPLNPYESDRLELRVYPQNGSGYWFVLGHAPNRWYWKDEAGADHFNRADAAELESAIGEGARVQICGSRGESHGVWKTWADFCAAVE